MNKIIVSVIIPTYNRATFTCDAIESILMQTFTEYEIIVVDDGSTDHTLEMLKNYKDKIRYILQKNFGPSVARNAGIRAAKGNYIAFLDSDDLWMPEKLEKQFRVLQNNPDISFCYTQALISKQGEYIEKIGYGCEQKFEDLLISWSKIFTSSVVIKDICFKKVGLFNEQLSHSEDFEMWLRILNYYKGVFVDQPLIIKRQHHSNISKDKVAHLRNRMLIYQNLLKTTNISREFSKVIETGALYFQYNLGDCYLNQRNYYTAINHYFQLVIKCPWIGISVRTWPLNKNNRHPILDLLLPYIKIMRSFKRAFIKKRCLRRF